LPLAIGQRLVNTGPLAGCAIDVIVAGPPWQGLNPKSMPLHAHG